MGNVVVFAALIGMKRREITALTWDKIEPHPPCVLLLCCAFLINGTDLFDNLYPRPYFSDASYDFLGNSLASVDSSGLGVA